MKYIDNKQENGLLYDYKKVRKLYKSLGCPKEYYSPCTAPIDLAAWLAELSQRATGKTTGWLLWGLCMYQLYGTVTHYVRATEQEIMPKVSKGLFSVILDNDYISKITDNIYNSIIYKARKWYMCKVDDNGDIVETDPNYCVYMCSVDKAANLKSSHNCPTGDLILYDEFISANRYLLCDFVQFCDLCKTILRDRLSGKIVLLANTIDKDNQYFHELEIYERISEMEIGENCLHTTDKGTNIYIEIVGTPTVLKKRKKMFNKMFLGFKNTRLSGITGETTWSVSNFPHIPDMEFTTVYRNIYIRHNNKYVNLEIITNETGIAIYCHWATQIHDDSIKLVCHSITDPFEHYGIAEDTCFAKLFKYCCYMHRIYFASNDVGAFVQNYLNQCGIKIALL